MAGVVRFAGDRWSSGRSMGRLALAALAALTLAVAGLSLPVPAQADAPDYPRFAAFGGSGDPADPGAMVPIAPFRALDTRASTAVRADSAVSFQVTGTRGIPAGVSAVVFNLTVTEPQAAGHIRAYASGAARPNTSSANFVAGQTVPNSVTVPVGADGKVSLFNSSFGATHLIADISGYYLPGGPSVPGAFSPVAPFRALDTRASTAVRADSAVSFQVTGTRGIPAGVSAVVFNLTVTEPQAAGHIRAYASGAARPNTSSANFVAGQTVPNSVTVPVGADGKVSLFNSSFGATHLIADISGYYLPGGPSVPGAFSPVAPFRALDTRASTAVRADSAVSFQVTGTRGIPAGVSAVVFNLTVTEPQAAGHIRAYASRAARPNTSSANFVAGQTVPNSVTVPVGADGKVSLFNSSFGATHLIADISGYYLPGSPVGSVFTWGGSNGDNLPKAMPALSGVTALTCTFGRCFAVLADGTVRAWGDNYGGKLGDGTGIDRSTPVQVSGLTGVRSVVASKFNAYALLTDGTVRAWGSNYNGALGDGTSTDSAVPVVVSGLTDVSALTTDGWVSYALISDGSVRAWGSNDYGQLGNGTTSTVAGDNFTPTQVPGLNGVTAISTSSTATYALLADGTLRSWGRNSRGQLGNGTTTDSSTPVQVTGLTDVKTITPEGASVYAVLTDGTVRAWGYNDSFRLGNGTNIDSSVPVAVSGLAGVKTIIPNRTSVYALLTDGSVRAWGANSAGELGNGTTTYSSTPVQVLGLAGVRSMAPGYGAVYALLADGTVRAWGAASHGQLGNGLTMLSSSTPVQVSGLIAIAGLQEGSLY